MNLDFEIGEGITDIDDAYATVLEFLPGDVPSVRLEREDGSIVVRTLAELPYGEDA
jgi:uncharacterized membrane protein YkoI